MRVAGLGLILCFVAVAAHAETTDPTRTKDVVECVKFNERFTAMVRAGDRNGARRAEPRARECLRIQQMALDRAARILASDGDAVGGRR